MWKFVGTEHDGPNYSNVDPSKISEDEHLIAPSSLSGAPCYREGVRIRRGSFVPTTAIAIETEPRREEVQRPVDNCLIPWVAQTRIRSHTGPLILVEVQMIKLRGIAPSSAALRLRSSGNNEAYGSWFQHVEENEEFLVDPRHGRLILPLSQDPLLRIELLTRGTFRDMKPIARGLVPLDALIDKEYLLRDQNEIGHRVNLRWESSVSLSHHGLIRGSMRVVIILTFPYKAVPKPIISEIKRIRGIARGSTTQSKPEILNETEQNDAKTKISYGAVSGVTMSSVGPGLGASSAPSTCCSTLELQAAKVDIVNVNTSRLSPEVALRIPRALPEEESEDRFADAAIRDILPTPDEFSGSGWSTSTQESVDDDDEEFVDRGNWKKLSTSQTVSNSEEEAEPDNVLAPSSASNFRGTQTEMSEGERFSGGKEMKKVLIDDMIYFDGARRNDFDLTPTSMSERSPGVSPGERRPSSMSERSPGVSPRERRPSSMSERSPGVSPRERSINASEKDFIMTPRDRPILYNHKVEDTTPMAATTAPLVPLVTSTFMPIDRLGPDGSVMRNNALLTQREPVPIWEYYDPRFTSDGRVYEVHKKTGAVRWRFYYANRDGYRRIVIPDDERCLQLGGLTRKQIWLEAISMSGRSFLYNTEGENGELEAVFDFHHRLR